LRRLEAKSSKRWLPRIKKDSRAGEAPRKRDEWGKRKGTENI